MKTHDWKPVSGLIHPYEENARREIADQKTSRRWTSDARFRVYRYGGGGYQAQVRIERKPR